LRMQPFAVWAMALLIVCAVQIRRMLWVPPEEAEGTAKEAIV